jgi:hypothetical protein
MSCQRCTADAQVGATGWCRDCELAYDTWVRRHASDIVVPTLAGMVVLCTVAIGLPLLGVGGLVAVGGVFAGFGTLVGLHRLSRRRRRRQFLAGDIPRAYLPGKT